MQEAAVAKKYASKLKAKADPERKGSGWWRMEDLKAAFKRFADNPDDPEASYFLAKALQMAGQAVSWFASNSRTGARGVWPPPTQTLWTQMCPLLRRWIPMPRRASNPNFRYSRSLFWGVGVWGL